MHAETIPPALLLIATPSECALLDWMRPKVTLPQLQEIAANDYRQKIPEHLTGIQAQLGPHPPLGLLPWCPREVLELERWSEPDEAYEGNPPSGEGGHLKRLLACIILLRNGAHVGDTDGHSEEDFFLEISAASLRQLTRSSLALGIPELGLGFALWLFDAQHHCALRPFVAFCALALAAGARFGRTTEDEILRICDWVEAEEQRCRTALGDDVDSERWLTGLNLHEREDRHEWLAIASHAFGQAGPELSDNIGAALRRFLGRLTD